MAKGIEVAQDNLPSVALQEKTFSSQALSLKDVIEGVGTVTTGAADVDGFGNATATVYHYLPYPPVHLVYFNPGNTNSVKLHGVIGQWVDNEKSTTWGHMDNFTLRTIANATTLSLIFRGIPNTVYRYKYFIFVEKAKT